MKGKLFTGLLALVAFVVVAHAAVTRFNSVLVKETLEVTGVTTLNEGIKLDLVDVTISTPTSAGLLVQTTNYVLYVSTGASNRAQWVKVGGQ